MPPLVPTAETPAVAAEHPAAAGVDPARRRLPGGLRNVARGVVGASAVATAAAGWRRRARRMRRIGASYHWEDPAPAHRCGPLVARTAGSRGRPVILVHGLAASARIFGAAFDSLGARHRLLAPDLLGFGDSPKPDSGYSLADHSEALVACVEAAGLDDEPAIVVGHSFGALVALAMARCRPDLVGGLVLVSPPLYRSAGDARHFAHVALTRAERIFATDTRFARVACTSMCMRRPRLARRVAALYRPELPVQIAHDGVRHTWTSYSRSMATLLGAEARPEWIADSRLPVDIISGLADRLPDLGLLRALAAAHAGVRLEEVEGGDHLIPLSDAPRCMAAVDRLADVLQPAV